MKRKLLAFILCIVLFTATLSGCSLNFFSLSSLLSPPMLNGKNRDVQAAFAKYVNNKNVVLKTPVKGDFQTAYILYDINNDSSEEALVFYVDNSVDSSVRMALLECVNDIWVIADTAVGAGTGVYDVQFADMDNDGADELFVGWSLYDTKTSRVVTVYSVSPDDNGIMKIKKLSDEYYNAKVLVDFNGDANKDLLLVSLDDSSGIMKSSLNSFSLGIDGSLVKYSYIALDSSISSVIEIKSDAALDGSLVRVFIDCLKTDNTAFSEVIYIDGETGEFIRAFDNAGVDTLRNSKILSQDIDGDGLLEAPKPMVLSGDDSNLTVSVGENQYTFSLLEWVNVYGDASEGSIVTLINPLDEYLLRYTWGSDVTVRYDRYREALAFCEWDEETKTIRNELFAISTRQRTDDAPDGSSGVIYEDGDISCYCSITELGKSLGITVDTLESAFKKY